MEDIDLISLVSQEFVDDYNQFRERIADLDRRLASIVCQGFDDCPSTESALKVKLLSGCFQCLMTLETKEILVC